ncbi:chaplin [Embleya sp. NPDC056575]|uniref:chaplin n=1 Tax=unclassified Embleya TaxID=2699296 RepID=UPI003686D03C
MSGFKKGTVLVAGAAAVVMAGAGAGAAHAAADADGAAVGSPGVVSGNNIQVPVHVPVNLCGNSIDVIGVLNFAFGNTCLNVDGDHDEHHGGHQAPEHGGHRG